jgi:hypothetical protein
MACIYEIFTVILVEKKTKRNEQTEDTAAPARELSLSELLAQGQSV